MMLLQLTAWRCAACGRILQKPRDAGPQAADTVNDYLRERVKA